VSRRRERAATRVSPLRTNSTLATPGRNGFSLSLSLFLSWDADFLSSCLSAEDCGFPAQRSNTRTRFRDAISCLFVVSRRARERPRTVIYGRRGAPRYLKCKSMRCIGNRPGLGAKSPSSALLSRRRLELAGAPASGRLVLSRRFISSRFPLPLGSHARDALLLPSIQIENRPRRSLVESAFIDSRGGRAARRQRSEIMHL